MSAVPTAGDGVLAAAPTLWATIRRFVVLLVTRLTRDKTAAFFVVVLPILVMVIIGLTFGSAGRLTIGVLDGSPGSARATAIIDDMAASSGTRVVRYHDLAAMQGGVRRHQVDAGVVLPGGFDAAVAAGTLQIDVVTTGSSEGSLAARDVLVSAASKVLAPADAATVAAPLAGVDAATAEQRAVQIRASLRPVVVDAVDVGRQRRSSNSFSLVAPQELVLFVFINALASGAALVRMRRQGVLRRVMAGPVGAGRIVVGLTAAWFVQSLLQSVLLIGVGAFVFGVGWGSPVAATVLAAAYAFVGASAGLLVGALGREEDKVSAITPPIGIVLGALGGCMVPLEVFSSTMRGVAHITPQYWAMTAWQHLVFDGSGIGRIAGSLAVLAGFAAVFLTAASVLLRRVLTRP